LQLELLKASSFGLSYLSKRDREIGEKLIIDGENIFYIYTKIAKILNNLREPNFALPLTFKQYQLLGLDAVVGRLALYNYHTIAVKLSFLLDVNKNALTGDWASLLTNNSIKTESSENIKVLENIKSFLGIYKI
jgi:hypothetical protein